ncbi:hypothetical protein [Methanocalculus sp. MC3]|nr:MAG: hypothetical protein XD88_2183 [Methanocalculus sp. 52_23]HIJ06443.1 hypothetical protein [Methanocalculus sp.]
MPRMPKTILIILLFFFTCIALNGTVSGATTSNTPQWTIERVIHPTDAEGKITVEVLLPPGMIGGITEELPAGYTFLGSTHPSDQIRADGSTILFAIIGEESITYLIRGEGEPDIRGSILDLGAGTHSDIGTQQSPAPVAAMLGALLSLAILIKRKER